jgi:hypothetical protein
MGDYEISVKKGTDVTFTVNFTDSDGVAVNITGWTVYFMVKTDINDLDADSLISKTITSHTSPTTGQTSFTITRANTEDLDFGIYVYDIQFIKDDGTRKGSSVDNFIITPSVRLAD